MPDQTPPVPRYALLGEDPGRSGEQLVHCETIAARSIRYNWDIPAHRHPSLCQLLLVTEGEATLRIDAHQSTHAGPFLLVLPSGTVHAFRFAPGIEGLVITLSNRFMHGLQPADPLVSLLGKPAVIQLQPSIARRIDTIGRQMLLAGGPQGDRELLRRALAEAALRVASEDHRATQDTPMDRLVTRFQALVEVHCRSKRKLAFYADSLGCTERTLSRRVRDTLGVSPIAYVNMRVAMEATRLLHFTNANCADVAAELGFDDPSYFSRFYLRMTGRRPSTVSGSVGHLQ